MIKSKRDLILEGLSAQRVNEARKVLKAGPELEDAMYHKIKKGDKVRFEKEYYLGSFHDGGAYFDGDDLETPEQAKKAGLVVKGDDYYIPKGSEFKVTWVNVKAGIEFQNSKGLMFNIVLFDDEANNGGEDLVLSSDKF